MMGNIAASRRPRPSSAWWAAARGQRVREPKRRRTGAVEPSESPLLGAGEPATEGRSLKKAEVLAFFFGLSRATTAPKVLNGEPLFRPMTTGSALVTLFEPPKGFYTYGSAATKARTPPSRSRTES